MLYYSLQPEALLGPQVFRGVDSLNSAGSTALESFVFYSAAAGHQQYIIPLAALC